MLCAQLIALGVFSICPMEIELFGGGRCKAYTQPDKEGIVYVCGASNTISKYNLSKNEYIKIIDIDTDKYGPIVLMKQYNGGIFCITKSGIYKNATYYLLRVDLSSRRIDEVISTSNILSALVVAGGRLYLSDYTGRICEISNMKLIVRARIEKSVIVTMIGKNDEIFLSTIKDNNENSVYLFNHVDYSLTLIRQNVPPNCLSLHKSALTLYALSSSYTYINNMNELNSGCITDIINKSDNNVMKCSFQPWYLSDIGSGEILIAGTEYHIGTGRMHATSAVVSIQSHSKKTMTKTITLKYDDAIPLGIIESGLVRIVVLSNGKGLMLLAKAP